MGRVCFSQGWEQMSNLHIHIGTGSHKVLHNFMMPIAGSTVQCSRAGCGDGVHQAARRQQHPHTLCVTCTTTSTLLNPF